MWAGVYWTKVYWAGNYWTPISGVVEIVVAKYVGFINDMGRMMNP